MIKDLNQAKTEEHKAPDLFPTREARIAAVKYFSEQFDPFWGLAEDQNQEGYIMLEDLEEGSQAGIADSNKGVLTYIHKLIKENGKDHYQRGQDDLRKGIKQILNIDTKSFRGL